MASFQGLLSEWHHARGGYLNGIMAGGHYLNGMSGDDYLNDIMAGVTI